MAPKGRKASQNTSSKAAGPPSTKTASAGRKMEWPQLQPLRDPLELELETVVEGQIMTIDGFWTQKLCKQYISYLSGQPLLTTPGKPKKGEALRVNDRLQVDDEAFARSLWKETCLEQLLNEGGVEASTERWGGRVVGLNPNIRIYRYSQGQFFGQHYDESNRVKVEGQSGMTTWTLLIYLSACEGGETVFYRDDGDGGVAATVEPRPGLALLHRHGTSCLLHEGLEVTQGTKWVVRSDVCVLA